MIDATIINDHGHSRLVSSVVPKVGDILNVEDWGMCEVVKLYHHSDNFIIVKWADDSLVVPQERNNGCPFRYGTTRNYQ